MNNYSDTNRSSDMLDFLFTFPVQEDDNVSNFSLGSHDTRTLASGKTTMLWVVRNLDIYLVPAIIFFGLLGNTLSFIVFLTTRLRVLSSSIYLAALAVSDNGFLVCVFVGWMVNIKFNFYEHQGLCQVYTYLTYIFGFLSVAYVVGFTVERYIVVCFPFRRSDMCTPERAKIVVIAIAVFALVAYNPVLWMTTVRSSRGKEFCHLKPEFLVVAQVINHADTIITFIVPSLAIILINSRITCLVVSVRNQQKPEVHIPLSEASSQSNTPRPLQFSRTGGSVQVTKLLLIVSSMFLFLNLPNHIIRLHFSLMNFLDEDFNPSVDYRQWKALFQYVYYINFSINFVLYSVCGRNFRTAMKVLLSYRKRQGSVVSRRQLN